MSLSFLIEANPSCPVSILPQNLLHASVAGLPYRRNSAPSSLAADAIAHWRPANAALMASMWHFMGLFLESPVGHHCAWIIISGSIMIIRINFEKSKKTSMQKDAKGMADPAKPMNELDQSTLNVPVELLTGTCVCASNGWWFQCRKKKK